MPPTVSELIAALPEHEAAPEEIAGSGQLQELFARLARRPIVAGALGRFRALSGLQARLGLAYVMYWIRSWFQDADRKQQKLLETHLRAALLLLETMGYLRGAVMKIGQTLASYPDIVPAQFVETLEKLHFEAPPMHFALLREQVRNELGGDPEDVFDTFETEAFAAASLGQVHRAQLKSGEQVAVKVQYPGIGRAVRSDFRNLLPVLLPMRLADDWESLKAQFDDVRRTVERETDYEQEAQSLRTARALFTEDDRIVVPRVFEQFSTRRVLTMQHVEGVHLPEFLARNPSQELRNQFAEKLMRAWYRMYYAGRMSYVDWNAGNFLFGDDGRLGLIDFGCLQHYNDVEWDWMRRVERPLTTGSRQDRIDFVKDWCAITNEELDRERIELSEEYVEWSFKPRFCPGPFDFGDEAEFRRGFDLNMQLVRKRYTRGLPCSSIIVRKEFGYRAMLYRLRAKIDLQPIAEQEVKATGWTSNAS